MIEISMALLGGVVAIVAVIVVMLIKQAQIETEKPTIEKPWSDPDADVIGYIGRFSEYERGNRE